MTDYNVTVSLGGGVTGSSGIYNVLDYGASKDGSTDDSSAINSAISAINASSSGGTILFPAGEYLVGSELSDITNSNVTISGYGAKISWSSEVAFEYLFSFVEESSSAGTITADVTRGDFAVSLSASPASGDIVSIKDGDYFFQSAVRDNKSGEMFVMEDGEAYLAAPALLNYTSGHAISIITPNSRSSVIGIEITGSGTDNSTGAISAQGCSGFSVVGCKITDVNIGVRLTECRDVNISSNIFSDIDQVGSGYCISCGENNYNVSVLSNNADRVRHFFTTSGERGVTRKVLVSSNSISRSRFGALDTHTQGYDISFIGNHVSDSLVGCDIRSPHSKVIGNVFHNCHAYPYPSEYDGEATKTSQSPVLTGELGYINLTISNNTISMDDDISSTIESTLLYGTGIDVRGETNLATPVFTAEYVRITGNTIGCAGNVGGISVLTPEGVTNVNVSNNFVEKAPYDSIKVYTEDGTNSVVSFVGNTVDNTARSTSFSFSAADATDVFIAGNTDTERVSLSGITHKERVIELDTVSYAEVRGNTGFDIMVPSLTSVTSFKFDGNGCIVAAADDTTPNVLGIRTLALSDNTGATAITQLDNGEVGQVITLLCVTNTNPPTIVDGGNFQLSAGWSPGSGDSLTLVNYNSTWYEISRSAN